MNKQVKRYVPLGLLLCLMLGAYLSGAYHYFSFEMLKMKHHLFKEYVNQHPLTAPLLFIGIYIFSTALSIPGGLFLSLLGGFLFPQPWSTLLVVFGATIGALLLFLAAKTALGDLLKKKAGPFLLKMEKGFNENATNYMLFLRFVPLFPFWLVNLAPAFLGVPLWTYTWTTFLGIIPGAFVFTQAGRGLATILEQAMFSVSAIFNFQLKIALVCLGVFALSPILIKKWIAKRKRYDR